MTEGEQQSQKSRHKSNVVIQEGWSGRWRTDHLSEKGMYEGWPMGNQ